MGWSSASRIFNDIIGAVQPVVPSEDDRANIYKAIIPAFEDGDWDTQNECLGADPAYDRALKELHPDWFDEEA